MEPADRVKTLAAAKAQAMKDKALGEAASAGSGERMTAAEAEATLAEWPAAQRRVGKNLIERYGPPNEGTRTMLIWYDNGPWKRTALFREGPPHNFPTPHADYLMQWIDYRVPVGKFDDVGAFDGSVIPDRTAGEVAARCDMEAANFLSINLMHLIVTGRMTVDEARKQFAESSAAYVLNRPAPYTERLEFTLADEATADPDEGIIAGAMMRQGVEKIKDLAHEMLGRADRP